MKLRQSLLFIYVLLSVMAYAQTQTPTFSKNALRYGLGAGLADTHKSTGVGLNFSVGYQRTVINDRFRINPNFLYGYYNANLISDVPDQWFNSLNLQFLFHGDIIRYKAFSITLSTGAVFNNTRGLIGTGGENQTTNRSEYFSLWHTASYISGCLRINPAKSAVAFELSPLTIQANSSRFFEGGIRLSMDVKLR